MNLDLLSGRVVAALVEGGYQGLLIIAAVWAALKISRRSNAATRYAAWSATLLIVAALPALHFVYPAKVSVSQAQTSYVLLNDIIPPVADASGASSTFDETTAPNVGIDGRRFRQQPSGLIRQPSPAVDAYASEAAAVDHPSHNAIEDEAFDESLVEGALHQPAALQALEGEEVQRPASALAWPKWRLPSWSWQFSLPPMAGLILVFAWASLSVARLVGLAGQVCLLRGLKRRAAAAPAQLLAPFYALVKKLGITRAPRLLITPEVDVPMVAGFVRPAVLIPERLLEDANEAQLEHIFRHELAHVARGDDWVNLLQQALSAVFFFHPGVHFVSRRMSVEREIACDDHALAAIKAPKEYALFLTEFAGRMTGRGIAAAPAAWSNRSQLKERITMILDGKRNASPRLAGARAVTLTAGAVLLAALTMAMAPRVALADPPAAITLESAAGDVLLAEVPPSGPREKSDVRVEVRVDAPSVDIAPPPAPPAPAALPAPAAAPAPAPRVRIERAERPERPERVERVVRDDRNESLERRLERLERLMEKLSKGEKSSSHSESRMEIRRDGKDASAEWRGPKPEELAKIREDAKHAAERARDDMKRAQKNMDMNIQMSLNQNNELAKVKSDLNKQNDEWKMAFNSERQAMKARREALENQRQSLERQIEALDNELEQKKEAMNREREKRDEERQRDRDREHEKRDKERREMKEKAEKDSLKEKSKDKEKEKEKDDGKNKNADTNENSAGNADIALQKS